MALKSTRYQKVLPAAISRREVTHCKVHLSGFNVRNGMNSQIRASILDVSIYGCRMELETIFPPGEKIRIYLANKAKVDANIVWQQKKEVGCRFEKPIAAHMMKMLLSAN